MVFTGAHQQCVRRNLSPYRRELSSVVAQARRLLGTSAQAVALLHLCLAHQQ